MLKNPPASAGDTSSVPGLEIPLEEEMATHSSILAWEIPWTEAPGGVQSMGLQRVRHHLETKPPPPPLYMQWNITQPLRRMKPCHL